MIDNYDPSLYFPYGWKKEGVGGEEGKKSKLNGTGVERDYTGY